MILRRFFPIIAAFVLLFLGGRWVHMQFAYAEIEKLTEQHSGELAPVINEYVRSWKFISRTPIKQSLEYFKVFEFSATRAKVFIAVRYEPANPAWFDYDRSGQFIYLMFRNGAWVIDESTPHEFVWSRLGSADDETWPPYR